ncbi:MAG: hypothetical protein ABR529_07340 [Actinomycetota bacterium]
MNHDFRAWGDAELEASLVELGRHVAYPPVPDLSTRVGAALRARPRRAGWTSFVTPRRALALATVAAVLLAAVVLGFSPAARRAVADWLGVAGIRIDVGAPRPSPARLGDNLNLGRAAPLQRAREEVDFDVLEPTALGEPDEVYVADDLPGGRVSLLYEARPGLPKTATTDIGLLLMEFRARLDEEVIGKVVFEGGTVDPVKVNGEVGYWIGGGPHAVLFIDDDGEVVDDTLRLAARTLVWQRDGVTLRLESALTKQEALGLARSVR